uniref:Uncharacterized protein n=1 Tax=Anguilla anguilla TaxID=7936 RepID=A0A0E9SM41_ANGAN
MFKISIKILRCCTKCERAEGGRMLSRALYKDILKPQQLILFIRGHI